MKKLIFMGSLIIATMLLTSSPISAQDANSILTKVDNILNAFKDEQLTMNITITDKSGKQSNRTMSLIQKGSDKRLVKFLTPADQKGIGFLSLPNDNLTIYLPAFGKTRKIASSVKNTKFAGTDFSYEDMEAKKYSLKWIPKLTSSSGGVYILELTPKPGIVTDYSKLIMYVRSSDCFPTKIEHFDKAGKLYKVLSDNNIVKVGNYTTAKELVMEDKRTGSKTKMVITALKYDNSFTDDLFSERELIK